MGSLVRRSSTRCHLARHGGHPGIEARRRGRRSSWPRWLGLVDGIVRLALLVPTLPLTLVTLSLFLSCWTPSPGSRSVIVPGSRCTVWPAFGARCS